MNAGVVRLFVMSDTCVLEFQRYHVSAFGRFILVTFQTRAVFEFQFCSPIKWFLVGFGILDGGNVKNMRL